MELAVEYKDGKGITTKTTYKLSRLALVKHMAIAGQGYKFTPQKIMRTIGMFMHYSAYLQRDDFCNRNKFSEPPLGLSDPTEKAQFSNLAGKAIADFLSKRIDKSIYTVNYEAAMRMKGMKISGSRPDLIAFAPTKIFSIEAKGYAGWCGNMNVHKAQSEAGIIPVNFTVASVAYDLYSGIKVNYHDPDDGDVEYDNELLQQLTRQYYRGFLGFLENSHIDVKEFELQGEKFYEIQFRHQDYLYFYEHPMRFCLDECFHHYRPALIIPKRIKEYAENGIVGEKKPFIFEGEEKNIYIDNDRIGLKIR